MIDSLVHEYYFLAPSFQMENLKIIIEIKVSIRKDKNTWSWKTAKNNIMFERSILSGYWTKERMLVPIYFLSLLPLSPISYSEHCITFFLPFPFLPWHNHLFANEMFLLMWRFPITLDFGVIFRFFFHFVSYRKKTNTWFFW